METLGHSQINLTIHTYSHVWCQLVSVADKMVAVPSLK